MQRVSPEPQEPASDGLPAGASAGPAGASAGDAGDRDGLQAGGASPSAARGGGVPVSRWLVYLLIAGSGAAADLLTKAWIFQWRGLPGQRQVWWVIDGVLGIETAVNIGAVFGVGAGKGQLFAAFSVIAGVGILVWLFAYGAARSWWLLVSLAMISGGIVGNLYDRLGMWWEPGMPDEWKSGVRDWILMQAGDAYPWPNYNIADSLLVVGAAMLCWRSFFPPAEEDLPAEEGVAG